MLVASLALSCVAMSPRVDERISREIQDGETPGHRGRADTCRTCESELYARLAVWNLYGLAFGVLSGVPSGEASLGLGRRLRARQSRRGGEWSTALGYELSLSVGGADYFSAFLSYGGRFGMVQHRHHLSAVGYGGRRQRLMYGFGGGLVLWSTRPLALEAQARVGYVFAIADRSRVRGVVGAQIRVVGYLQAIPLPHFSVFIGLLAF